MKRKAIYIMANAVTGTDCKSAPTGANWVGMKKNAKDIMANAVTGTDCNSAPFRCKSK